MDEVGLVVSVLLGQVSEDGHGVVVMLHIEVSGEVVDLSLKLELGDVESVLAVTVGEGIEGMGLSDGGTNLLGIESSWSVDG